jgi:hypothetical protein
VEGRGEPLHHPQEEGEQGVGDPAGGEEEAHLQHRALKVHHHRSGTTLMIFLLVDRNLVNQIFLARAFRICCSIADWGSGWCGWATRTVPVQPGKHAQTFGKDYFQCTGAASILAPVVVNPGEEWRGAQVIEHDNL